MRKPRHICLFIGTLGPGGAERVMSWLAERLADNGVNVTLVTLSSTERDFVQLDPRVERCALDMLGSNRILSKPWVNLRRIAALRKILRDTRADTILAFMPHESVLAIIAGRLTGRRVAISERNAPWHRSAGRPWNTLRRLLYRFSHVQIAQTIQVAQWFEQEAACDRVCVVPNAVLPDMPSESNNKVVSNYSKASRKLIIAVGTKAHQKGFDLLIEAFSRIADRFPEWDLALLGLEENRSDGGLSGADIAAAIQAANLRHRVYLPGRVGNVGDWYEAADIFVLSSRFEGFPNVLIEAMAHGCAVLSTDCETGPRGIIRNGCDGMLIPTHDAKALEGGLECLMSDDNLRARLSHAAPAVRERYSEDRIARLWFDVLGLNTFKLETSK